MAAKFEVLFTKMTGRKVSEVKKEFDDPADPGVWISFIDGTKIYSAYWRLLNFKDDNYKLRIISSFDHGQKYGLKVPIDAVEILKNTLMDQTVETSHADTETGDLDISFKGGIRLQIFAFTDLEEWEVEFPDGQGQYSNYFGKRKL